MNFPHNLIIQILCIKYILDKVVRLVNFSLNKFCDKISRKVLIWTPWD